MVSSTWLREAAWQIREAEAKAAGKILGIAEIHFLRQPDWILAEVIGPAARDRRNSHQRKSALVYVPHPHEWHPDHKAAVEILKQSLGYAPSRSRKFAATKYGLRSANIPSSVDITAVMPRKLEAIRCHFSQLADFDYAHAAQSLNAYRGVLAARASFAEVFEQLPRIMSDTFE